MLNQITPKPIQGFQKKKNQNQPMKKQTNSDNEEDMSEVKMLSKEDIKEHVDKLMKAKKNDKQKENQFGVTELEFINITFNHEWPKIIKSLADVLMGGDILKSNKIVEEDDQGTTLLVEMCKENELA